MTRNPILISALLAAAVLAGVAVATTPPAGAGEFEEHAAFTGRELTVTNLVGAVHIEGTGGNEFEVVVNVRGKDASRDHVRIEKESGDHDRLDELSLPGDASAEGAADIKLQTGSGSISISN